MYKTARRALGILVISLVTLAIMLPLLISLPPIQNFVVRQVVDNLSGKIGTKISVDKVDIGIFKGFSVEGLYVEDLSSDTLLFARKVEANISILKLFEKKVEVNSVTLDGIKMNIVTDKAGNTNVSVLSRLFETTGKTDSKWSFVLQIKDIRLINSSLSYRDLTKSTSEKSEAFDAANILLSEINGQFVVDMIDKNYYKGRVGSLSFVERSGLRLKNLETAFLLTDSNLTINKTSLSLPHSELSIDTLVLGLQAHKRILLKGFTADIAPADIAPIAPQIGNIDGNISIKLSAEGVLGDILVRQVSVRSGNSLAFTGNMRLIGLPDIEKTYISCNIENLYGYIPKIQDLIAVFNRKPLVLPQEIVRIKEFSYKGEISGYLNSIKIIGNLRTHIGTVYTDLNIKSYHRLSTFDIDGRISCPDGLDLSRIIDDDNGLSSIVVEAYAEVHAGRNVPFESNVNANIKTLVFNGYTYNNISLNGQIARNRFEGNASLDDENGKVRFHGLVDLNEKINKKFQFEASVRHFRPNRLSLIEGYENLELNFGIAANFTGNKIENVNGTIVLDSIAIKNNGIYTTDKIYISSKTQNDSLQTIVESDLINGYISGKYAFAKVPSDIMNMIYSVIPILRKTEDGFGAKYDFATRNNLGFYFEIEPLKKLCDVLNIGWTTTRKSTVSGFYNGDVQMFNLGIEIPQLVNGNIRLNSTRLNCYNDAQNIKFVASSSVQLPQDSILVAINSDFESDSINMLIAWKNFDRKNFLAGEIFTNAKLSRGINNDLNLDVNILPTQIEAKNKIFDVRKSSIFTDFKTLTINHFAISNANQSIKIDGVASKLAEDKLQLSLNDIDLGFVSSLLPKDAAISFGGIVTGNATLSQVFDRPSVELSVASNDFIFNGYSVGKMQAVSQFNHNTQSLDFEGKVSNDSTMSTTTLKGKWFVFRDSLFIAGEAHKLRLRFIEKFVKTILAEVDGYGTGWFRLGANLKEGSTTVETKAAVDKGRIKIDILGSDFYFSDTLELTKDKIIIDNIELFDSQGNKAIANGYVSHRHFIDNIKYKIDIQGSNILIFNRRKSSDMPFFGQVYASGYGTISGTEAHSDINYIAIVEPNSKVVIALDDAASASSSTNNFLSFSTADSTSKMSSGKQMTKIPPTSTVNLNLTVNVNPNAQLQLLIDQTSGDMIQARGEGIFNIGYNSKTEDMSLKGAYTLTEGKYLFTFQQALEREFSISPGSTLVWNGDPTNPTINLKAIHKTRASVKGLFDPTVKSVSNAMIPVNCILNLSGVLTSPNITFDIELPNSTDDTRRALKNIINTEEMMNRQIIYLLAFGRFYNPNSNMPNNEQPNQGNQTTSDVISLVASTLGSQLNNLLSQISDKFTIGVNIKLEQDQTAGTRNNEYGVNINYAPNERIMINSSLGYRDDDLKKTAQPTPEQNKGWNNAILDFELEYKLNQSGRLAGKVYNRTNSIQDFKDAPYTQGVGVIYQESFNSLKSLIAKYRKQKKKTKNNKETKTTKEPKEAILEEKNEKQEK